MLKFKKVYIDSSYKVSGTSSEFTIDLPETVQLGRKYVVSNTRGKHSSFVVFNKQHKQQLIF